MSVAMRPEWFEIDEVMLPDIILGDIAFENTLPIRFL